MILYIDNFSTSPIITKTGRCIDFIANSDLKTGTGIPFLLYSNFNDR